MRPPLLKALVLLLVTLAVLAGVILAYSTFVVRDYYSTFPGEMGPTILEGGEMTIEIDHPSTRPPEAEAVAMLKSRAEEYTGRVITVVTTPTPIPRMGNVTIPDAVALEREYRATPPVSGERVSLYILYVEGVFSNDENTLAVAYLSLSVVVFTGAMDPLAPDIGGCGNTAIVNLCQVERSVLLHEFGHILGLVNSGYVSPRAHHDTAHPYHCTDQQCVMYYEIEGTAIGLRSRPPASLGPDCRADLDVIRASSVGKYYLKDPRFVLLVVLILGTGTAAASFSVRRARDRPPSG